MSKSSATEALMGMLHAKVAKVMVNTLEQVDTAQDKFREAMASGNDEVIMAALGDMPEVSPAFLSAVTKFLADNKITCQIEEDETVSDLSKRLADKRKRKSVGNVLPFDPNAD